jgi:hypothetical protein
MMTEQSVHSERRRFMRHPAAMPIACRSRGHLDAVHGSLRDASLGGMFFVSDGLFAKGDAVDLSFPARLMTARVGGVVVWRQDHSGNQAGGHAYGVQFDDKEMFARARLLEQICHIEAYQKTQAEQCGRRLSPGLAAEEWIAKYASQFPR